MQCPAPLAPARVRVPMEKQPWFIRRVLDPSFEHPLPTWFEGGDSVAPFEQSPAEEVAKLMGGFAPSGDWSSTVCCDLGCGNGSLLVAMAKAYRCRVVGVDLEHELVGLAHALAEDEGVPELLAAFQGNLAHGAMWEQLLRTMGMPAAAIAQVLGEVADAAAAAAVVTDGDEALSSIDAAASPPPPAPLRTADDGDCGSDGAVPASAAGAKAVTDLVFFTYLLPEGLELVQPWLEAILALNDCGGPAASASSAASASTTASTSAARTATASTSAATGTAGTATATATSTAPPAAAATAATATRGYAFRTHVIAIHWQFPRWVPTWWIGMEGGYGGYGTMTVYSGRAVRGHMNAKGTLWVADGVEETAAAAAAADALAVEGVVAAADVG